MSLTRRFQHLFSAATRSKGEFYNRDRRVSLVDSSPGYADAIVEGSEDYEVWLSWDDAGLEGECDCPAFMDFGPCKHMWAVLLAVENLHPAQRPAPPRLAWRNVLAASASPVPARPIDWPPTREAIYVLSPHGSRLGAAQLSLHYRDRKRNGEWSVLKDWRPKLAHLNQLPDALDRETLTLLRGGIGGYSGYYYGDEDAIEHSYTLSDPLAGMLLPRLAAAGRLLGVVNRGAPALPLSWDEGEAYVPSIDVEHGPEGWRVAARLRRGEQALPLNEAGMLLSSGFMTARGRLARLDPRGSLALLDNLRRHPVVEVPAGETGELMAQLAEHNPGLLGELPEELRFGRENPACRPLLRVTSHPTQGLSADVLFDYGGRRVHYDEAGRGIFLADERRLLLRDAAHEREALSALPALGFRRDYYAYGERARLWLIPANRFPAAARTLVQQGWVVEAEGRAFRPAGTVKVHVTSGIDWFSLDGQVEYGETSASLVDILKALRQKEQFVRLGDGSMGLLPEEWLAKFAPLVQIGTAEEGELRFRKSQAGLLDALLAALPEATWDEAFAEARQKLLRFQGVEPAPQPAGFAGELRGYQKEGLGWLQFLRDFGFGGCLADDMGLGKTAQVLAYLEDRRAAGAGPSLVVVPRSLVFNWQQEAARFTPQLRVLDYSGAQRRSLDLDACDLVLATYGTLRRDVVDFRERVFDTIVLDEAQAIKNHTTEAAKAARLLRGEHRLALSGTPIENHLGELWSLFEYLNPGLLGSARAFQGLAGKTAVEDPTARNLLAHALRPFILRRTKEQVAKDLPAKTEQTLYCELEGPQKKLYQELLDHYRVSLLAKVDQKGLAKSKMHVLEALLRLRQAACHPALVDAKQNGHAGAKLELLLEQIAEVVDEGHKVLIFSQFTSLLALLKPFLDEKRIVFEYLDGQTRDRQQRVERFQNDPACPVFLISLKAGGLGLNLTAAEYVYLLDPWWNPAVEAQAIDRTHRIGQTQQVFAYRIVARNTVEEKILELQNRKRDLAAAIITEDNAVLRKLTREDLELLLS